MKNSTTFKMAALALSGLFAPMLAQADIPATHPRDGYLKVFTATQEVQWGDGSYFYPRTGYLVYTANGSVVKQVGNQTSVTSNDPEQVELAPGTYTVRALTDAGFVSMRVTIKPSQVTEVRP